MNHDIRGQKQTKLKLVNKNSQLLYCLLQHEFLNVFVIKKHKSSATKSEGSQTNAKLEFQQIKGMFPLPSVDSILHRAYIKSYSRYSCTTTTQGRTHLQMQDDRAHPCTGMLLICDLLLRTREHVTQRQVPHLVGIHSAGYFIRYNQSFPKEAVELLFNN